MSVLGFLIPLNMLLLQVDVSQVGLYAVLFQDGNQVAYQSKLTHAKMRDANNEI